MGKVVVVTRFCVTWLLIRTGCGAWLCYNSAGDFQSNIFRG